MRHLDLGIPIVLLVLISLSWAFDEVRDRWDRRA